MLLDQKIAIRMDGRGAWRDSVRINRQVIHLTEPKRCSEKPPTRKPL